MKKIDKSIVTDCIKKSSIFILMHIIMILLITTLLFFVGVTVSKFHLPVITILTIGVFWLFYKKDNIKVNIVAILIGLILFTGVTWLEGKVYDITADGNTYHKLAIGSMKNGWNPNYEDSKNRNKENGNPFDISAENRNTLWIDHYAKGTEIYAAVIYAFTGNIESGKGYTLLLMYVAFGIIFSYLYEDKKRNLFISLAVSLLLAVNCITAVQIFNYYVDGALMISLLLILYSLIVESDKEKYNQKENLLILASNIILCINIKFTGVAFAAVFCFVFYVYWIIRAFRQSKEEGIKVAKKYTIFYIITVVVSLGIIGYSSYMRNLIDHGHPLYPLYGKEHVENMVVAEQPTSFADKSHLEIFLISIFSKGQNVSPSYSPENIQPSLKIPFTMSKEEIDNYTIPDIRVGGFGPLFSVVFIVSIIGTIIIIAKLIKEKKWDMLIPYLLILGVIAILLLALDGNYWARYIPYFYAVPIIVLTYLLWEPKEKIKYILGILLSVIMVINVGIVLYTNVNEIKKNDSYVGRNMEQFIEYYRQNENVEIRLNYLGLQGVLYNLKDLGIENYTEKQDLELESERDGFFFKY